MIRMTSRTIWLSALAMLLYFAAVQSLQAAEVKNVRLWTEGGVTRVVLDLDKRVHYNLFPLRAPDRLVIDLEGSHLASNFKDLPAGSGAVRGLRAAKRGADGLRIVLDLDRAARPNSLFAGPVDDIGERLVIDLPSNTASVTTKQSRPQSALARDLVVAIDPGHGGRDPGAIGRGKTREKDVVLSIARKLARRVDAEPGMSAYLIRSDDTLVDHVERMERARRKNADIFISIHADAFTD
ncbi:MAG: N-acetylmuramoyl-L-alanine amidase, partial [Pseudomonadota bacterium]